MSDATNEELEALLRQHAFEGSGGLLRILSLCATAGDPDLVRTESMLERETFVAWDRLQETVRQWAAPPMDRSAFYSWLHETEDLGCARKALHRLSLSTDASIAVRV